MSAATSLIEDWMKMLPSRKSATSSAGANVTKLRSVALTAGQGKPETSKSNLPEVRREMLWHQRVSGREAMRYQFEISVSGSSVTPCSALNSALDRHQVETALGLKFGFFGTPS